jgi:hypothetical protein
VAVVALFGFMVVNTGPDEGRRRALAVEDGPAVPACAGSDAAVCTGSSTLPDGSGDPGRPGGADDGAGRTGTTLPAWAPIDADLFCSGARGATAFDLRIMAALLEEDVARLRTVVSEDGDAWRRAADQLAAGAPRSAQDDVALYRAGGSDRRRGGQRQRRRVPGALRCRPCSSAGRRRQRHAPGHQPELLAPAGMLWG